MKKKGDRARKSWW